MGLKDRVLTFIKAVGTDKANFERKAGLSNDAVSKMGDNTRLSTLEKISTAFPELNINWLRTGEGEMLKTATPASRAQEASLLTTNKILHVPLVNQYAHAGYVCGYNDITYLEQLPTIPFLVDYEGRGNYMAFEVRGDSMDNGTDESYKEGDRLLCREIPSHLWVSSRLHIRQWDFVIVHEEGILVKRIVDHNVENHTITIHSLNELYPDREIDLAEVKQIFNVVESVRPRRR